MKTPRNPRITVSVISLVLASPLAAQTWSGATSSSWATPSNWNTGAIPAGTAQVTINNVSAATPFAPVLDTNYLLNPDGGNGDMFVGRAGGTGTLDINAGSRLDQSGNWLFIGNGAGSVGTVNVAAGGQINGDNQVRLGEGGGNGTLNVNGGTVIASAFDAGGGIAQIHVNNSGTVTTNGNIRMNGNGTSSIDSGSIATGAGQLLIGASGTGGTHTLDMSGGTVTAGSWIVVGHVSGSSVLNVSGGNITQTAANRFFTVGANGNTTGTITQTGGVVTDMGNDPGNYGTYLGESAGCTGTYNLNGGDFHTARIRVGGGTGNLRLNGGTLHARQNDETFIGPAVNVDIQSGGAFINTEGFSVTMNRPLSGVGNLTKLGAGVLNVVGDGDGGVTFPGTITVSEGGIGLGGNFSNLSFNIPAAGAIGVTDTNIGLETFGTLSIANLTMGAGAAFNLNCGTSDASDKISATNVTLSGAASVNFVPDDKVFYGSKAVLEGVFTLVEYSGTFTGNVANLSVGNPEVGYVYNFANTGSAITLEVILNDSDGDTLPDDWELANFGDLDEDYNGNFDGDFATNGEEFVAGTNPNDDADDPLDVDNDDMLDTDEVIVFGNITYSNGDSDTDGDCESDRDEVNNFGDPKSAAYFTDDDFDGLPDAYELAFFGDLDQDDTTDFDADNFTDLEEYQRGTNPALASWSPAFAKPTHRWSFNNSLADSIGGANATIENGSVSGANAATLGANQVTLTGGGKTTSQWVKLGSNLLPEKNTAVTVETWATNNQIQNWSRVFSFHDDSGTVDAESIFISWTQGTDAATNRSSWSNDANDPDSLGVDVNADNIHGTLAAGTKYHIAMTICPDPEDADSSIVTFYSAEASAADLGAARGGFTITARISSVNDLVAALGRSRWEDATASASYDEMRIYDGCLPIWALEASHDAGPDAASLVSADSDSDGLPDSFEMYYFQDLDETLNGDSDNDFTSNRDELLIGTDPSDSDSNPADTDGDGLPDAYEIGTFGDLTQGADGDFDGDFETNLDEFTNGTNPNDFFSATDADNDLMGDAWETMTFGSTSRDGSGDFDGDTISDLDEYNSYNDPTDPTDPGAPDGDADGDGLPDLWEVTMLDAVSLADYGANDNPDSDADNNLAEYKATSDPLDMNSTVSDINGDGFGDQFVFDGQEAAGAGLLDIDSQATGFTNRLAGSGALLASPDTTLDLDTALGTLAITTNDPTLVGAVDINGQLGMDNLQAIGIPLSSLGFTGTEDFRIRAHYIDMPLLDGFDQIGIYAGTATTSVTRAGAIGATYQALGVNTNGTGDANATFVAGGSGPGRDLTVVIERIGGVWSMSCNGVVCTAGAQPNFLDGNGALEAGVFVLAQNSVKTVQLESFTAVSFGTSSGGIEIVSSGFDAGGNFVIELADDAAGSTVWQSPDLQTFTEVLPANVTISGSTITIAAGALDPDNDKESYFQITR